MLTNQKLVENRKWSLRAGWWALHVGKNPKHQWACRAAQMYPDLLTDHAARDHTSAVIGFVYISEHRLPHQCNGHRWAFGPICNVISHVIRLPRPIPILGQRGPWKLPPEVVGNLRDQLRGCAVVALDVEKYLGPSPP